jgi:hypothetical protein
LDIQWAYWWAQIWLVPHIIISQLPRFIKIPSASTLQAENANLTFGLFLINERFLNLKRFNLIIFVILVVSLTVNVVLAVNYSNNMEKVNMLAKRVDDYAKKLATIKKETK